MTEAQLRERVKLLEDLCGRMNQHIGMTPIRWLYKGHTKLLGDPPKFHPTDEWENDFHKWLGGTHPLHAEYRRVVLCLEEERWSC